MEEDIVYRLRKRAEIRRQISTRKSVQEGKPDRLADLLDEAAIGIERYKGQWERASSSAVHYSALLEQAQQTLSCPNSDYGTHRCIRCDSEVE